MAFLAQTTSSEALTASVAKVAVAKVWMGMASATIPGKLLSIFIPISTFVTLGFEHSVANMFLIFQGMLAGADVSIKQFLVGNMLPVTLGNIVGGAVFVAGA